MPRKPPYTEVVSAEGRRALAGSEDGRGDVGEGEVFGGAAGALLPVEKELAVAVGEAGGGVDVEFGEGAVDPVGGAFEFGVGADGGFVDDEVCGGVGVGTDGLGPLGAVFLVDEDGDVAELLEDFGEGVAFGDGGFGLDADLVAGGIGAAGSALRLWVTVQRAPYWRMRRSSAWRGGRGWGCRRGCCARRCGG